MVEIITEPDVMKMVKDKEEDLGTLYKRMDVTRDLLNLEPYKLKGFDGKTLENVVSVTLNSPAVFANNIIADLVGSVYQWYVEGDLSKKAKTEVENFLSHVYDQLDEGLVNSGTASLQSWLSAHVVARSLIGARFVSQIVKGEYSGDLLPMDMRYVAWEFGKDGLKWHSYRTVRSQRAIYDEYNITLKNDKKTADVVDVWNDEKNWVFIDGELLPKYPQKHKFGRDPAVIVLPASGFMLRDEGFLEHESPDVLFLNKDLYEAMNRDASIKQTKALETVKPAYMKLVEQMDAKPAEPPPKTNQTRKVKIGEEYKLLDKPDLTPAITAASAEVGQALEDGGYSGLDIGRGESSDTAIKLSTQYEIRGKFLRSRKEAIQLFRNQLGRMIIEQARLIGEGGGGDLKIGKTGKKMMFKPALLTDPDTYTIDTRVMTRNKTMEIANAAIFKSLEGSLPYSWLLENLMFVDEPEKVIRQMELQKIEMTDPTLSLLKEAENLADEIDDKDGIDADLIEAKFYQIMDDYKLMMRQRRMQGQPQIQPQQPKGNTNALAAVASRGM